MLTSLLLLALAAWSVPSVSAAVIQSRQASSNIFSLTVSGSGYCNGMEVAFYDAGYNFIEKSRKLTLDRGVRTYTFSQNYTPAFASFQATSCPDRVFRYQIHSISSYGLVYNINPSMYLVGDDGLQYNRGGDILKTTKTTAMLINDGKKKDGTLATVHVNRFTVGSYSGLGTLDLSIRADCANDNLDMTAKVVTIPWSGIIPGKTYSLTGFNEDCRQFLIMDWKSSNGSVSLENDSLVINGLVKPSTTSDEKLHCQNWSQAGAPYATSISYNPLLSLHADGSLSAGTYNFYCENSNQKAPGASGLGIQKKVPFVN